MFDLIGGLFVEKNVIVCDLNGIFKWVICDDGIVLVDNKYMNEWNIFSGD